MKRRLSSTTRNVAAVHARVEQRNALCGAKRKWGVLLAHDQDGISCARCRALLQLSPRFMTPEVKEVPADAPPILFIPKECCKNVSDGAGFVACGKDPVAWYKHGDDICSFCKEHNTSPCGEPIDPWVANTPG